MKLGFITPQSYTRKWSSFWGQVTPKTQLMTGLITGSGQGVIINQLIIFAILLLGLFFRVYHLGNESIWLDEAYSVTVAKLDLHQLVVAATKEDFTPPLYYIILHWWINLFGDSEFSSRFPSFIFGVLAIFMIYKVGSLLFDEHVGIISSLILGLSTFHIRYSQEARAYSLMALMTLLSIYFFVKFLEKRTITVSIAYLLSSTLLMYAHPFGSFIILAQNIYVVTMLILSKQVYKFNFKIWILSQLILIVLFAPGISFLIIKALEINRHGFAIEAPTNLSIAMTFLEYSSDSSWLFLLFLTLSSSSMVACKKIQGKISWKGFFKSIESCRWTICLSNVERIYLLLLWLLTPIILPFIISRFSTPIYLTRYTIAASLAFYILVAKGICNINSKYIKLSLISVLIVLSLIGVQKFETQVKKDQWREVSNYIDTKAEHGDLLVFDFYFSLKWPIKHYSKKTDLIEKSFSKEPDQPGDENINDLVQDVKGYKRIWYILSHTGGSLDDKKLIKEKLGELYKPIDYQKFVGIEVYLFEKQNTRDGE